MKIVGTEAIILTSGSREVFNNFNPDDGQVANEIIIGGYIHTLAHSSIEHKELREERFIKTYVYYYQNTNKWHEG